MSETYWVRHSLLFIALELAKQKFQVSKNTVRRLLRQLKYRLYANRKTLTKTNHPDRNKQFRYIQRITKHAQRQGYPIISVDTKKKELIGDFFNAGRRWAEEPDKVNVYDFPQDALGRAVPYGIYDLVHNQGYVYVGTSYDTSEFAAYAIAQWWSHPERPRFQREDKLFILADGGGSNSYRYWIWKQQVQEQLANQFGLEVMICHYPTGASKWNPIEHRLFSQISCNWAGKPLRTWDTMVNLIRRTTTHTGLTVKAFLVNKVFEKGRKVSEEARKQICLHPRWTCPNWNYIIKPNTDGQSCPVQKR